MRICRFAESRIGLVEGNEVIDVTAVLEALPQVRWPLPRGDMLIAALPELGPQMHRLRSSGPRLQLDEVALLSPIANPGKIDLELIEVQVGSYTGEDDIVRLEDVYARA